MSHDVSTETEFKYLNLGSTKFQDGAQLDDVLVAYETYGQPVYDQAGYVSNAVVIFHALSGSCHAAGINTTGPRNRLNQPNAAGVNPLDRSNAFWTEETHRGWFDDYIGRGKFIDTNHVMVVCASYLGSCYGSTGPASINPQTNRPYGSAFPQPSVMDQTDAMIKLLDHLRVAVAVAVIGPSMGGFMAADFLHRYPSRTRSMISIASAIRQSELDKIRLMEQESAIMNDAQFNQGDYYDQTPPLIGLETARRQSAATFINLEQMERRAKQILVSPKDGLGRYRPRHALQSYLLRQGHKFVMRFDANAYLRIIRMWDAFDLTRESYLAGRTLFDQSGPDRHHHRVTVLGIKNDYCIFPCSQEALFAALKLYIPADLRRYTEESSDDGHDAFLTEPHLFGPHIERHLKMCMRDLAVPQPMSARA